MSKPLSLTRLCTVLALFAAAWPALAMYKVIGPDGSVTYTDRPPSSGTARVTDLGRPGSTPTPGPDSALPFELRQAVTRFPVTLYSTTDCAPCDSARQFLQQRGVPYSERLVANDDDAAALERLVGGRTVPALTIGGQALRGLSQTDWTAYLDAAGYPRESRLPRNWQAPTAAPLTARASVARPARPEPAAPVPPPEPTPEPAPAPSDSGVRF